MNNYVKIDRNNTVLGLYIVGSKYGIEDLIGVYWEVQVAAEVAQNLQVPYVIKTLPTDSKIVKYFLREIADGA